MAYTIFNPDGSILNLIPDNSVDQFSTSLALVGRNVSGFGQYINNNFVQLLTNFASDTINSPRSPLTGQLWYDIRDKKLKVYDNGFKNISGAVISPNKPTTLTTGDLWFDSLNNQLKLINGNGTLLIGPAFSKVIGENGWVLPLNFVRDINLFSKNITFLKNHGNLLGILSHEAYTVNDVDSNINFNTSTMSIVAGLKIFGDINYTGKINDNYHTLTVDLDRTNASFNDISNLTHFTSQTNVIINMLNAVFPINSQTSVISHPLNSNSIEVGVPKDSEARVICYHTVPFDGYQVRKFKATPVTWDYVDLTNNLTFTTLSNVITTVNLQ